MQLRSVLKTSWKVSQKSSRVRDTFQDTFQECIELRPRYSVCKRQQEIVAVADTPEGCAEGQLAYEGSCYQFYHDYLTYDDAQGLNSIEFQQDVQQNFQQITGHSLRLNTLLKITLKSLLKFNWIDPQHSIPVGHRFTLLDCDAITDESWKTMDDHYLQAEEQCRKMHHDFIEYYDWDQ